VCGWLAGGSALLADGVELLFISYCKTLALVI